MTLIPITHHARPYRQDLLIVCLLRGIRLRFMIPNAAQYCEQTTVLLDDVKNLLFIDLKSTDNGNGAVYVYELGFSIERPVGYLYDTNSYLYYLTPEKRVLEPFSENLKRLKERPNQPAFPRII